MIYSKEQARLNLIAAVRLIGKHFEVKDWRTEAETRLKRKLDAFFKKMNDRIAGFLSTSPAWSDIPEAFWDEIQLGTLDILLPEMRLLALEGAERLGEKLPMAVNWELVNQRAVDAATNYAYNRVTNLTDTGRNLLQESISDFFDKGWTHEDLVNKLIDFGEVRADMIATTETTRASAMGEYALSDELEAEGVKMIGVWHTENDELVCEICGPRDGMKEGDGWERIGEDGYEQPPAHVNCRCWVGHESEGYYD